MTAPAVVVVDPYSSGATYAPALRRAGFAPISVRSAPFPAEQFTASFRRDDFDRDFVADTDIAGLTRTLSRLGVRAVLPGSESGVTLADRLAAELTPAIANAPSLAHCRRHKGHMTNAVAVAGLPVTPTICVRDPVQAAAWVARPEIAGHDLVIKPATSVSTDGVTLAPGGLGWQGIVAGLLDRVNATGVRNDEVVLQRRLFGTEYVVNTFTLDGRHRVTDVWRYTKVSNGGHFAVYQDVEFVPMDAPYVAELVSYVQRALDALGFAFGPAHTEIMLTADGPRLVEINSRVAGSGMAAAADLATGDSAVKRVVRYLLGERDFAPGFRRIRSVMVAMLMASRSGIVANAEVLDAIRALSTCRRLQLNIHNGDRVEATSDLLSSLRIGWALLAHRDAERVREDHDRLREHAARLMVIPAG